MTSVQKITGRTGEAQTESQAPADFKQHLEDARPRNEQNSDPFAGQEMRSRDRTWSEWLADRLGYRDSPAGHGYTARVAYDAKGASAHHGGP